MLTELTRELIDIPSVTGDEAAVATFLAERLAELGYAVERQPVAGDRFNIFAGVPGRAARVVFSTHLDTVPPHIASREDEEFIYGRGACDTKGIIAAQLMAAEELRAAGRDEIGLLFVVDEETGSTGAKRANLHPRAAECRYLINGEPTENKLALGSKGSLRLRLAAEGRAAHSAYPERGDSAIEKLLAALERVRRVRWPTDDFFGETTCNVGVIGGGTRSNVIPEAAFADLHVRLVTSSSAIRLIVEDAVGPGVRVEYLSVAEPLRMIGVGGFETSVVRFTTDIPHLGAWGAPLLLGPGSILDAHTAGERISKREQQEAVGLYAGLARALLAGEEVRRA